MTAIILISLTIVAAATAKNNPNLKVRTSEAIRATWVCEDKIPRPRTRARTPWAPHSQSYRRAQLNLWTQRLAACRKILARSLPSTNDWVTAVRIVQRVYPGTQDWLLKISHREGGWGPFVMNHQGSGCGGWMQFMESTFWAYAPTAYNVARAKGWRVDGRTLSWTNPLGQALTAGYMRYTGRDGHHWDLTNY